MSGKEGVSVPADATVSAEIGFGKRSEGGYGITADLTISLPGIERDVAQRVVEAAHALALKHAPDAAAAIRRCVHNRQLPQFNPMLAYFGGKDAPIYEGVGSLWFDNAATVGAFRAYERALLAINADPATAFYRPDQSFFLYAHEVQIYQRDHGYTMVR